jgi:hypothetical protein
MADTASEATATASTTRRTNGIVTRLDRLSNHLWPLRAATAYSKVLSTSQPEIARPSSLTNALRALVELVVSSHWPKCVKSTAPSTGRDSQKKTTSAISQARTAPASI